MGYITEHRGRRQHIVCLVQDNFLTQHVLEPTREAIVLDIVLSSQKECVDNVEIRPRNSFFWVVANICYQVEDQVAKLILW